MATTGRCSLPPCSSLPCPWCCCSCSSSATSSAASRRALCVAELRGRLLSVLVPLSVALLPGGALVSAAEPSSDPIAASPPAGVAVSPPPGMVLVWADEFDAPAGAAPDPSRWTYDLGDGGRGWGNEELEWYTDRPANAA